ncbi:hypothetical protein EAI30_10360 [Romboutsia ilealis]|uniref:Lipoprotein n=1 Tax=Romboutsia faecis TaxID=2764597 RepID=A0ABR7JN35_9FIRM|nr:hypothetical protein [Romboutsia faecis]MBC5996340.1 hypothetical protein [Romboutsia faecis]MRN25019.1 hypothetical protein [Romboutsia ilealis]
MKKCIICILFFILLLTTACTMNNSNNSSSNNNYIKQASADTTKLIGTKSKDLETSLGIPYSAIYYIDSNKIKYINTEDVTLKSLEDSISVIATYKNNNKENPFLHVYFEDGIVKNSISGDYNLRTSKDFISSNNLTNSDYKVEFYNHKGMICKSDFVVSYAAKEFFGKSISDFNTEFNLNSANFIASTINNKEKLYFYPLVPHKQHPDKNHNYPKYSSNNNAKLDTVNPVNNNLSNTNKTNNKDLSNYSDSSVVIYTKDNKIQSITIEGKDFVLGLINKAFSK